MKLKLTTLFIITIILGGCVSQQTIATWKSPEANMDKYKKLFIAVLSDSEYARLRVEHDLAEAASARFEVVKSSVEYPLNFTDDEKPDRKALLKGIQDMGCDVILTVTLTDVQSETRYVAGGPSYSPYSMYGGGFYGYYNYWYPVVYEPGYYSTSKTYFLEANAFDASDGKHVWSVQSKAFNPTGLERFSEEYTELLVKEFRASFPQTEEE